MLTSDIKGYKNFCDALRPALGKEIGTTVFALSMAWTRSCGIELGN